MSARCKGILILSAGAKSSLVAIAKPSAHSRGLVLHASDRRQNVPTRLVADKFTIFDQENPKLWIQSILDYCSKNAIGLVIPTRHQDLSTLSQYASIFHEAGVALALSDFNAIETCLDKLKTFERLKAAGIPCPDTWLSQDFEPIEAQTYIAKPRFGASSIGIQVFDASSPSPPFPEDTLIQTLASGHEYTINAYIDKSGKLITAIPHQRLIVENGESVQARTCRNKALISVSAQVVKAIPGFFGPINIQAFWDDASQRLQVIEINPRLGGGFPLAHQAKGAFIEWLCREILDGEKLETFDAWTNNLLMMRSRDAFFELQ